MTLTNANQKRMDGIDQVLEWMRSTAAVNMGELNIWAKTGHIGIKKNGLHAVIDFERMFAQFPDTTATMATLWLFLILFSKGLRCYSDGLITEWVADGGPRE